MIRTLRLKLIAAAMLSLLAVLLIIVGCANLISYRHIVEDADQVLALLAENNGVFPKPDAPRPREPREMSPELPYESRYFSVLLREDGSVVSTDTGKIAAVDTSVAIEYAQRVWTSGRSQGFLHHYRYIRQSEDTGVRIIFLDCARSLSTFRDFLFTCCWASLLGLLAVFVLLLLLSRRIIRPVLESYEKQKRFITDAGHEIKTPLTILSADADVLELELGENEWLQDIQHQAGRLARLTRDLIYLSRMEEEQSRFQSLEFSLSDAVEESVQSFLTLAHTREKELRADIQPLVSLRGDEDAVRHLLSVLLDNGVKYCDPGGTIQVSLIRRGRWAVLSVENPCATLDPASLPHLFDRFYRGDASRSGGTGGYGIGLSIAQAVTAAHRGRITALSPAPHVLRITVSLPL